MKTKIHNLICLAICLMLNMSALAVTTVTIGQLNYQLNGTEAYISGYVGSPTNVEIPNTITSGGLTFKVTKILKGAFYRCTSITSVKAVGENLITIGDDSNGNGTFGECTSLVSISFSHVQHIGWGTFNGCSKLKDVWLGTDLNCLYGHSSVESSGVFANCTMLSSIIIPRSCTNIGSYTFKNCNRLQSIIYLGTQTAKYGSNANVYNVNNMLSWRERSFVYSGKSPTTSFTSSLPAEFQPTSNEVQGNFQKNVGTYNTNVPVTFKNGDIQFTVYIPYSYTITPVTLTARVKNATKVYGSANPQFQTEYTGFITGEDESVLTSKGTYSTSAYTSSSVGTYSVTLSGAIAPNYTIQYESGTLTITKAPLTMTARDKSMVFGDRVPNLEVDYAGLQNNESSPAWITSPSVTTTATSTSNAGSYPIVISGGQARNYNVTFKQGTLTISKASLTATTRDATREYGDENPEFDLSYSGLKNGETAPVWAIAPTFATPATKTSPVGTYSINANGGEARNYMVQYVNAGKLTIEKAPLTAKARNYTKKQGEENPVLAVDYVGFKNGETKIVLTQEPIATTTAGRNSQTGTYPITLSGGIAMNYEISYVDGTLTILPNDDPAADEANTLSIESLVANKNAQAEMFVALKNEKAITGVQFDLYLPDGITVAKNSKGKMLVSTTSRMDGSYSISCNEMDGFIRILGYSADGEAFTGSSGDILSIKLDVSNNIAIGNYTVRIKDIVLSDINNKESHPADAGAVISVKSYTLGDVDNSGAVNINDVVCIINYILNKLTGTFVVEAADIDQSGSININDVVTLINRYILNRPNSSRMIVSRATENTNLLYLAPIEIKPGETMTVEMLLDNANEVKAVQGNIKLPKGLSFVTKSNGRLDVSNLNDRSEDFTLSCAIQDDGSMTFAHYSADGFAYDGHQGGIFTFKIKANENAASGTYYINLSDVVLSINGVAQNEANRTSEIRIIGEEPEGNCVITLSSTMQTYCPENDVDFSTVSGLKAYTATGYDHGTLTISRVLNAPAGTGLLLQGELGTYTVPYASTTGYYINLLHGILNDTWLTPTEGNQTNFLLGKKNNVITFYRLSTAGTVSAGRAYLQLPTNVVDAFNARGIRIVANDETTGIREVYELVGIEDTNDSNIYNLKGCTIVTPQKKGIYIINGKKVVIR